MRFLSNLFGRARKALTAEVAKLRSDVASSEVQIRKDIAAMEARLKVAMGAMLHTAEAEAPAVIADVTKAAVDAAASNPKA